MQMLGSGILYYQNSTIRNNRRFVSKYKVFKEVILCLEIVSFTYCYYYHFICFNLLLIGLNVSNIIA